MSNTNDPPLVRAMMVRGGELLPSRLPLRDTVLGATITSDPDPKVLLPTLLTQTLIIPDSKTAEGVLIASVALPWRKILKLITEDSSLMYQIDPWRWEEIIAASYQESGRFDEVILTPRSNDGGKDVIAIKKGYGSIRFVESVKRYNPGNEVTADDVRALGFLLTDPRNSKGIVSTTWKFAPKIEEDPLIKEFIPYRLELVDGVKLIDRCKLWANPDQKESEPSPARLASKIASREVAAFTSIRIEAFTGSGSFGQASTRMAKSGWSSFRLVAVSVVVWGRFTSD